MCSLLPAKTDIKESSQQKLTGHWIWKIRNDDKTQTTLSDKVILWKDSDSLVMWKEHQMTKFH